MSRILNLKKLNRSILARLTELSEGYEFFHDFFRVLFLGLTPKIISSWFCLSGLQSLVFIPRHSLTEAGKFNVFASDLDYTIICTPADFSRVYLTWTKLKTLLPNLGELEMVTPEESEFLKSQVPKSFSQTWRKILLVRKFNHLSQSFDERDGYQRVKDSRALSRIKKTLSCHDLVFKGEELQIIPASEDETPYSVHSLYLDCRISNQPRAADQRLTCFYETRSQAEEFLRLLPGSLNEKPLDLGLRNFRISCLCHELLLVRISSRLPKRGRTETSQLVDFHEKLLGELAKLSIFPPAYEVTDIP